MVEAADKASRANAPAEAERLYRRTVELARAGANPLTEARALDQLGALFYTRGHFAEAVEALKGAIALYQKLGARNEVAFATQRLGRTYNNAGMLDAGVEILRSAILFLTPEDEEPLEEGAEGLASLRTERALASLSPAAAARIGLSLSIHLLESQRPQRAFAAIVVAERYAHAAHDGYTEAHARSFHGEMLAGLGRLTEAVQTWQSALEMARRAGNDDMLVSTLLSLAHARIARGEWGEAKQLAQEAWEGTIARLGDVTFLVASQLVLGEVAFVTGEWREARTRFEQASATADGYGAQIAAERSLVSLARLDIAEGKIEAGLRVLRENAASDDGGRQSQFSRLSHLSQLPTVLALAEYDLFAGDPTAAARRLTVLRDTPSAQFSSLPGLLAQSFIRQGDFDQARIALDQALPLLRAESLRLGLLEALYAQALLDAHRHQWSAARQTLDEALDLAQAIAAPTMAIKLLTLSGEISMTHKRPAEARSSYSGALEVCDRLGERLYRERIQRALDTLTEAP
jgi:tetratricopeptide (TPR) repeat protein